MTTGVEDASIPLEPDLLKVTYQQTDGAQYQAIPMTLAEAMDLLRRMPPRDRSWVCYVGRSGEVVQIIYELTGITERPAYQTDPAPFSGNRGGQQSGPVTLFEG